MTARFTTTRRLGHLSEGTVVDLVHLTGTGRAPARPGRDPHYGDGLWWRVRSPSGFQVRMVRAGTELAELGINASADLVPARRVTP